MSSSSDSKPRRRNRPGAGRPAGTGLYGESTQAVRVPRSWVPALRDRLERYRTRKDELPPGPGVYRHVSSGESHKLPLFASKIPAGFPSPADDYIEDMLDLERLLVQHPAATFYLRVSGDSMSGAAIMSGDLLVVDRSIDPAHGRIVVASIDNELTVKRLYRRAGRMALEPENPAYQPIEINDETDLRIWGVVTGVVRQV
jgi:DNA polymerase V